jgi:ABC-type hemin transport system ATPase subunit
MLVFLLNLSKKTINFAYFLAFAKREDKSLSSGEGFRVRFFGIEAQVYPMRNEQILFDVGIWPSISVVPLRMAL